VKRIRYTLSDQLLSYSGVSAVRRQQLSANYVVYTLCKHNSRTSSPLSSECMPYSSNGSATDNLSRNPLIHTKQTQIIARM